MDEYLIEYYRSHPRDSESQTFYLCSLPACSLFGASGDGHTWHVSMCTHTSHTHTYHSNLGNYSNRRNERL